MNTPLAPLFRFEFFAVLSIETNDRSYEPEPDSPILHSAHLTREDADRAIISLMEMRAAQLARQNEAFFRQWFGLVAPIQPSTTLYIVVPYSNVNSSDLESLQEELETAAMQLARTQSPTQL